MKIKHRNTVLALTLVLCLVLAYLCIITGVASVSVENANRILLSKLFHLPVDISDLSKSSVSIIWNLRVPRVVLAFIAGASLAVCGAGYQGVFRNPMADPFILGVSAGAALGAAVAIVFGFHGLTPWFSGTTVLAFAGAFGAILIVYSISRIGKRVPVTTLLLSGIAVSNTLSAVMNAIMMMHRESTDRIIAWTMGSLNGKGGSSIQVVLPYILIGIVVLMLSARELDIMLTGEENAVELGVNVEALKRRVLFASTLITASVISVTGIVGFVGLVVPHVVRLLTGPKHRVLLPVSLVVGGAFLTICDTAARSLTTQEIPVGVITAICGGPFFLYLLRKTKKGGGFT